MFLDTFNIFPRFFNCAIFIAATITIHETVYQTKTITENFNDIPNSKFPLKKHHWNSRIIQFIKKKKIIKHKCINSMNFLRKKVLILIYQSDGYQLSRMIILDIFTIDANNHKRRNRQNVNALRLISEPVVITRSNRYTSFVAVIFSTRFCNCCPWRTFLCIVELGQKRNSRSLMQRWTTFPM